MGKVTLKSSKKRATSVFSRYIRLKYMEEGEMNTCYTCGKKKHWKKMQAGHGLGGRTGGILFLEAIVRPQCYGCNIKQKGKLDDFVMKLIDEIGLDVLKICYNIKKEKITHTIEDYQIIEDFYKRKIEDFL